MRKMLFVAAVLTGGFASAQTSSTLTSKAPLAAPERKSAVSLEWSLWMAGQQTEDPMNSSQMFNLDTFLTIKRNFGTSSSLTLEPRLTYDTGFVQSEGQSSDTATNWAVRKAEFNSSPSKYFAFSAGALNQRDRFSRLMWGDRAIPAVELDLHTRQTKGWTVGARALSGVVSSTQLATETAPSGQTPQFQSLRLSLNYKGPVLQSNTQIGSYKFTAISQSLAKDSAIRGNSVNQSTETNQSTFESDFEGYFIDQSWTSTLKSLKLGLSLNGVQNQEAENQKNTAYMTETRIQALGVSLKPEFKFRFYRVESDAAIASLLSSTVNTNRQGYRAELNFTFEDYTAGFYGGLSDSLTENPNQRRENFLGLQLETLYELL